MPNKQPYRGRLSKRFLAWIRPLHRLPLETAHIGHYRLLSFVPVDCRCVVAVATEIQALVSPPHPHLAFVYLYISLVLSDMEFWVLKFWWVGFRADRDRRTLCSTSHAARLTTVEVKR